VLTTAVSTTQMTASNATNKRRVPNMLANSKIPGNALTASSRMPSDRKIKTLKVNVKVPNIKLAAWLIRWIRVSQRASNSRLRVTDSTATFAQPPLVIETIIDSVGRRNAGVQYLHQALVTQHQSGGAGVGGYLGVCRHLETLPQGAWRVEISMIGRLVSGRMARCYVASGQLYAGSFHRFDRRIDQLLHVYFWQHGRRLAPRASGAQ
jgi:hypothetical protein